MNVRSFIQIGRWEIGQIYGEKFLGENFTGWGEIWGGNFEKKMKTYKFPSKKEYMYEVSSKSENGKMVKFRGKIFWGGISQGGGKFRGGILNIK